MILVDTSAVYALADAGDPNHASATDLFEVALAADEELLVHSYLVSEAANLLRHRMGSAAALAFLDGLDTYRVHWIAQQEHDEAVALFRERGRRRLSLVDCASFVVMRLHGVSEGLFFDADFPREGFRLYGDA